MHAKNLRTIYLLGVKELWTLWRDPMMLLLIVYVFTVAVYTSARAMPQTLHNASIAIVDEDASPLSRQIALALYPPQFSPPAMIDYDRLDQGMDAGLYTFALIIPPHFQRDALAGKTPVVQLNVDATRMSQAFTGSYYVRQIVKGQVDEFLQRHRTTQVMPVELELRARFNPALDRDWFSAVVQVINYITLLAVILAGAALVREREHGTIEHLLVMPITPAQIMLSKVWSMGLIVLVASFLSLHFMVQGVLAVPIHGSVGLFFVGAALSLFASTSIGIFLVTLVRNMPQLVMLMLLIILPMQLLSGGNTPRESMPEVIQHIMLLAPTTHFVDLGQSILFRDAGLEIVWRPFLALGLIGSVLFLVALARFRKTLGQMAG